MVYFSCFISGYGKKEIFLELFVKWGILVPGGGGVTTINSGTRCAIF